MTDNVLVDLHVCILDIGWVGGFFVTFSAISIVVEL